MMLQSGRMWVDLDGSLGLEPGSTVVATEDNSLDQCYPREEWNLKVCEGRYAKVWMTAHIHLGHLAEALFISSCT